jgi:hypothetical protein
MNKRLLYVSFFLISCITILSQCISKGPASKGEDIRGEKFAGAATCAGCHKNIYDSYIASAHYKTSSPASKTSIKGSFAAPDNVFFFNKDLKVVMEERDSGLFQAAYMNGALKELHRFDITVGSGRKGQTFLYWKDGQYFQLPLSYFIPVHSWANSPGFPPSHPKFDRMIPSACFGCHSSKVGIKSISMVQRGLHEEFEKNQLVYGIDCERCHGPAAAHVAFHTEHPDERKGMHIKAIGSLKNQQKLDMCALCHSGLKTPLKSTFDFRPGDALTDYFYPEFARPKKARELDVHGTQYELFSASKCFRKTQGMNCSTCHNPHSSERNVAVFSQRCMECHNNNAGHIFCKKKDLPAATLAQNCIDCHMPALPSGRITMLANGNASPTADSVRTHLITIYEEATKKVMERY